MLKTRNLALLTLCALAASGAQAGPAKDAKAGKTKEVTLSTLVREKLERLPNYGVFDVLNYAVAEDGSVELSGFAFRDSLKKEAEAALKDVPGIRKLTNNIEDLPWGVNDDEIRAKVFLTIYRDGWLSRYGTATDVALANGVGMGPRGRFGVFGPLGQGNPYFPGFNPSGDYGIHIMVSYGDVTLAGDVDSEADKILAELKARQVFPVKKVYNELTVKGRGPEPGTEPPTRTKKNNVIITDTF